MTIKLKTQIHIIHLTYSFQISGLSAPTASLRGGGLKAHEVS